MALAAFGRAIAEVGAVMIVGGNIDGVTRVMTTTIALETSKGDLPLALALGVILIGVVLDRQCRRLRYPPVGGKAVGLTRRWNVPLAGTARPRLHRAGGVRIVRKHRA